MKAVVFVLLFNVDVTLFCYSKTGRHTEAVWGQTAEQYILYLAEEVTAGWGKIRNEWGNQNVKRGRRRHCITCSLCASWVYNVVVGVSVLLERRENINVVCVVLATVLSLKANQGNPLRLCLVPRPDESPVSVILPYFVCHVSTAHSGPGTAHCWCFTITLIRTTLGRTLDEWRGPKQRHLPDSTQLSQETPRESAQRRKVGAKCPENFA
jgi:hypothetical protein